MDEMTYLIAAKLQADLRLSKARVDSGSRGGREIEHKKPPKDKSVMMRRPTMTDSWRLVHLR